MGEGADASGWSGRRVLVTGHTGFIGGWLTHALLARGALVSGYANNVPTTPSLFEATGLATRVADHRGDIADFDALADVLAHEQPEVVFHLAAQPLVRRAFAEPLETYRANVMGTLTLLEALRRAPSAGAAVLMTTDKVYRNHEWIWPYRESDALGGHEPYGLSKAMAELAIAQYRETYLSAARCDGNPPLRLVAVRAGNVIGGGDWSEDRLVPDAVRAWSRGETLAIRSPASTRPWQHVLDVVDALLRIADRARAANAPLAEAYNVGPDGESVVPVGRLVERLGAHWGDGARVKVEQPGWAAPESRLLALDSTLFRGDFGWRSRWPIEESIARTVAWYRAHAIGPAAATRETERQIREHGDGGV
ncbi:MAG: CDP-glucose 4,6-dehydratase [Pseudomonadota bacterium]